MLPERSNFLLVLSFFSENKNCIFCCAYVASATREKNRREKLSRSLSKLKISKAIFQRTFD